MSQQQPIKGMINQVHNVIKLSVDFVISLQVNIEKEFNIKRAYQVKCKMIRQVVCYDVS